MHTGRDGKACAEAMRHGRQGGLRPQSDAEIAFGGEVLLPDRLHCARKWARVRDASVIDRTNNGLTPNDRLEKQLSCCEAAKCHEG